MRIEIAFVWASLLALALAGCGQTKVAGGEGLEKRIADLEKEITATQDQNRDIRAKLHASHTFGRSPLDSFFASPEFWQCTYDSSWSDCANACSTQTSAGFKACLASHPEGPERVKCVDDNTARGSACLKNCPVQTSPIGPPICRGGSRPM